MIEPQSSPSSTPRPKTALVTGASSGIGRATAERLAASGYQVFGTSRTPCAPPPGIRMLRLDVGDADSVGACVAEVTAAAGPIDVLVSNAGAMVLGPVEEVPLDDAQRMFDTNFWGAARMINAVLPAMRERRAGHVVLVGSIAANVAIPLNGFYAASKAALARYAEALRHETRHFGVRVALVEPGDYRTRFWSSATIVPSTLDAYAPMRDRVLPVIQRMVDAAPEPSPVAEAIARIVASEDPDATTRIGAAARRVPRMRAWMPARVFEAGLRRRFGLGAPFPR